MPNGVVGFCTDFMFTQVGLSHGSSYCDGIDLGQVAVSVEEQALLRDVDEDMLTLRNGGNIGNNCMRV